MDKQAKIQSVRPEDGQSDAWMEGRWPERQIVVSNDGLNGINKNKIK